jgi:hypothetical protein
LVAHARRLLEATDLLGVPFSEADRKELDAAFLEADDAKAHEAIERVLEAHCLVKVHINPESRVKAARGPARAELVQNGWRLFLVKVQNDSGTTAELITVSPNARAFGAIHGTKDRFRTSFTSSMAGRRRISPRVSYGWIWIATQTSRSLPGSAARKRSIASFNYTPGLRLAGRACHLTLARARRTWGFE